jgi:hypothetical protein
MAELKNTVINDTGFLRLPSGTTAQRPGSPVAGMMRFNSEFKVVEQYVGAAWKYLPPIVENGLVLHLDAAEPASYPGTGNTWTDLSGNGNDFTLFNSPSFTGGYFNFDGTNQYARSTSTLDLSPYTSITVEIGFRVNTTVSPSGMAFEHGANWNTQTMGFGLIPNSSGSTTYVSNSHHTNQSGGIRFDYDGVIGTDVAVHTNIWTRISDSSGRISYINAVQRGLTSTGNYPNFRNDNMFISSRGGSSIFANHRVYFFRVYGRKLSASEIQQNFNALRGRYGI